ncbi:MAG: hypothetical protein HOO96_12885 [Polyangiaceae bacterium]|nr:hypothetical protein [Polyangiaceae bacterium]
MSISLPSRRALRPALAVMSFGALVGSTAVLVGDSADCPDGYNNKSFAATYDSDCPPALVDPTGTLRLTLTNSGDLTKNLEAAGIKAASAFPETTGKDKCDFVSVVMRFPGQETNDDKCKITLDAIDQTATCNYAEGRDAALSVDGGIGRGTCHIHLKPLAK